LGLALKTSTNADIPTVDPFAYTYTDPETDIVYANEMGVPAAVETSAGDGLLDIAPSNGKLHYYIHQGNKADLLTSVDTGTGRHLAISTRPLPTRCTDGCARKSTRRGRDR
jgi:hypothetical protein